MKLMMAANPPQLPFNLERPLPVTPVKSGATASLGAFNTALDMPVSGLSSVPANQLIYSLVILSRIVAASQRSANEVRETVTRDLMGWTFWFFGTPFLQRMVVRFTPGISPEVKNLVLDSAKAERKGILHSLNPVKVLGWGLASGKQLKDQEKHALNLVSRQIEKLAPEAEPALKAALNASKERIPKLYQSARRLQDLSYFVGLMNTVGLLGIGIPLVNTIVTKRNVEKRDAAREAQVVS